MLPLNAPMWSKNEAVFAKDLNRFSIRIDRISPFMPENSDLENSFLRPQESEISPYFSYIYIHYIGGCAITMIKIGGCAITMIK